MLNKIEDSLKEQLINGLFSCLDEAETIAEARIINNCMTLLINGRSPEQVKKMEIDKFNQSMSKN